MAEALRILIIDDSEDDRSLYERYLRNDAKFDRMEMAETGEQGIDLYKAAPADCVLLDYSLPGYDGLEILKRLRAHDPNAAVVMMTGAGSEDIAVAAMKSGAIDYVVKDTINAAGLRRALINAVEKRVLLKQLANQREEQIQFIRILVHDIRAPLRGLTTFSDFLMEDLKAGRNEELLDHLELITLSTARLNALVDTLAHYALSGEDLALEPVAINDIMSQVIDNLGAVAEERGAEITAGPLPVVKGHEPQLIQLLQNLVNNGIKYNRSEKPAVQIAATRDGDDRWLFRVTDNGIGVPEHHHRKIFEPFERLWSQDSYEGTGLGLAICRKIVERHGGRIWCESEEGRGSRFFFTLPNA